MGRFRISFYSRGLEKIGNKEEKRKMVEWSMLIFIHAFQLSYSTSWGSPQKQNPLVCINSVRGLIFNKDVWHIWSHSDFFLNLTEIIVLSDFKAWLWSLRTNFRKKSIFWEVFPPSGGWGSFLEDFSRGIKFVMKGIQTKN